MEKELTIRAKNSIILDLTSFGTLKEINDFFKLSPQVGYFYLSSVLLLSNPLTTILNLAREHDAKIFLNLDFILSPEQAILWGGKLNDCGLAMINIQCSSGKESLKCFMAEIRKNEKVFTDNYLPGENEIKKPRPRIIGTTIPTYKDQAEASRDFGNYTHNTRRTYDGYIEEANMDGVICTPATLKSYDNEKYNGKISKLATNIVPFGLNQNNQIKTLTPEEAIRHGADYLIIHYSILSKSNHSSVNELSRILITTAAAINERNRLIKISPDKIIKCKTRRTTETMACA